VSIPIQNLYYLLVYAWDVLDEAASIDVGARRLHIPEDLFAKILNNGVTHLLKRGLDRAYKAETEEIPGIRGKLELATTIKRISLTNARLVCTFDDLTHDVLHNQILKATLLRLARLDRLDAELRRNLSDLVRRFDNVRTITIRNEAFRQVQLHSNNRFYRLLLEVCALLHRQLLPDPSGKGYRFSDFSPEQLERIFQRFVRHFYAREQSEYKVSAERFRWQKTYADESVLSYVPTMETDVSMESAARKLVIETKFYQNILRHHHKSEDHASIISGHLYQLFAYLQNLSARDKLMVDGLLLYARVEDDLFLDMKMFDHNVRVATVDLSAAPDAIASRLFECAGIASTSRAAA
jgi:5-methylcytosine-specific restriction enzyme subunit McrC